MRYPGGSSGVTVDGESGVVVVADEVLSNEVVDDSIVDIEEELVEVRVEEVDT